MVSPISVIADNTDKKLKKAVIVPPRHGKGGTLNSTTKKMSDTESMTTSKTTMQYMVKDTIIYAIPINVTINDNPLDEVKIYKIRSRCRYFS